MITPTVVLAALGLTASVNVMAQDPYTLAPQAYKKQLENEWVRVTKVHYAPNEKIAEHGHPVRPTIYIYLQDGGPVLFKHEHGISKTMAAVRPAIHAGAYRLAAGRDETHVVENQSDVASDFLQVEIKTPIDLKTFPARRSRESANVSGTSGVEIDIPELRIRRVVCAEGTNCDTTPASGTHALVVLGARRVAVTVAAARQERPAGTDVTDRLKA